MQPVKEMTVDSHPLQQGQVFFSPGCHFSYRVLGPCCRLFDREQLPWPCCRLQWRGKEPSWRRIGKRFTVDLATRNHPSYCVEILGQVTPEPIVITLYSVSLPPPVRDWWHSDRLKQPPAPLTEINSASHAPQLH
ncbi:MAG: hypothetical protein WCA35_05280 [Kovacikia sp.]